MVGVRIQSSNFYSRIDKIIREAVGRLIGSSSHTSPFDGEGKTKETRKWDEPRKLVAQEDSE